MQDIKSVPYGTLLNYSVEEKRCQQVLEKMIYKNIYFCKNILVIFFQKLYDNIIQRR